jgi:hypothetical protein
VSTQLGAGTDQTGVLGMAASTQCNLQQQKPTCNPARMRGEALPLHKTIPASRLLTQGGLVNSTDRAMGCASSHVVSLAPASQMVSPYNYSNREWLLSTLWCSAIKTAQWVLPAPAAHVGTS